MRRERSVSIYIPEENIKKYTNSYINREIYPIAEAENEDVEEEDDDFIESKTKDNSLSIDSDTSGRTDISTASGQSSSSYISGMIDSYQFHIDNNDESGEEEYEFDNDDFPFALPELLSHVSNSSNSSSSSQFLGAHATSYYPTSSPDFTS
jgi:hypothetical protein